MSLVSFPVIRKGTCRWQTKIWRDAEAILGLKLRSKTLSTLRTLITYIWHLLLMHLTIVLTLCLGTQYYTLYSH